MIVSAIPGRIRLRDEKLHNDAVREGMAARLLDHDAVHSVKQSALCGSLLVGYEVKRCSLEAMIAGIHEIAGTRDSTVAAGKRAGKGGDHRALVGRITKLGMLSSLGTSGFAAFLGPKALHKSAGKAFFGFAGLHMLLHGKRLLK